MLPKAPFLRERPEIMLQNTEMGVKLASLLRFGGIFWPRSRDLGLFLNPDFCPKIYAPNAPFLRDTTKGAKMSRAKVSQTKLLPNQEMGVKSPFFAHFCPFFRRQSEKICVTHSLRSICICIRKE